MDNKIEIWKNIVGYEGFYQISNIGNIKGLERTIKYKNNGIRVVSEKILKKTKMKVGYFAVNLTVNSKLKLNYIHRLVAESFIPNPDNKPQVNHINGIKDDNRVENLEWVSSKENCIHAFQKGLNKSFWKGKTLPDETKIKMSASRKNYLDLNDKANRGENGPSSKLKNNQVIDIFNSELKTEQLAIKYNVSTRTIYDIKNRKTWKSLNL